MDAYPRDVSPRVCQVCHKSTHNRIRSRCDEGDRSGCVLGCLSCLIPRGNDKVQLELDQFSRKVRKTIGFSLRTTVFNSDVLSFYVTKLTQGQPNSLGTGGLTSWIA